MLLIGMILLNGITGEVIHRGLVLGPLPYGRSFGRAALLSSILGAASSNLIGLVGALLVSGFSGGVITEIAIAGWFQLSITNQPTGEATLTGPLRDQAELHGMALP